MQKITPLPHKDSDACTQFQAHEECPNFTATESEGGFERSIENNVPNKHNTTCWQLYKTVNKIPYWNIKSKCWNSVFRSYPGDCFLLSLSIMCFDLDICKGVIMYIHGVLRLLSVGLSPPLTVAPSGISQQCFSQDNCGPKVLRTPTPNCLGSVGPTGGWWQTHCFYFWPVEFFCEWWHEFAQHVWCYHFIFCYAVNFEFCLLYILWHWPGASK